MILLADGGVTTTTPESISGDPIQSFVERHKEVSTGKTMVRKCTQKTKK